MDYLISQLKTEINQKLGFAVQRQADVKYLHEQITISVLNPIGFNTLRRFFGFLPSAEPQFKTLDVLSEFLGYKSFSMFSEFVNKDEKWARWTFISDFENTNSISSEMLERLLELKPQPDYNYFISVIIKSFIRRERVDLLKILFVKSSQSFLFKKNDISYEEALEIIKIAYAVGGVLRTLPKTKYQKLVPLLSDKYTFKSNILDFYIDYSNFNGYYGFFIENRILIDNKPQDQIFVNLISQYNLFLSGASTFKIYSPDISKLQLYPALYGRLFGYSLITTHFKQKIPISSVINQIEKASETQHISVFFIEIFPALIFIKAFDEIQYLIYKHKDGLFETDNWRYYSTQNTYRISLALVEIKNKNYDKAEYYLQLVTLDHSITNSYYAYLKLFYLITSYQLELQTTNYRIILNEIHKEYLELVHLTGFKRFTLSFLKKYF